MRRGLGKRPRSAIKKRATLWIVPTILVLAIVSYITAVSSFLNRNANSDTVVVDTKGFECVAWRQTRSCTPYGVRDAGGDRDCQAWVSRVSGYCECQENLTTKRKHCGGYMPFTCEQACARLAKDLLEAEQLPPNVTCHLDKTDNSLLEAAAEWLHISSERRSEHEVHLSSHTVTSVHELDHQASRLWRQISSALDLVGQEPIRLPESRTVHIDWVRDGVHIPSEDIQAAKAQWEKFMDQSPQYPVSMFQGKGIVILAGGLTYMVPAWVNIHMLRRTGCALPVEMFFPRKEYPTAALEAALAELGVVCRKLPELRPTPKQQDSLQQPIASSQPGLSGFTMKIAALILSQFREVIFLDSDNVAVRDPSSLLRSEEYLQTGALLWPDFWASSAAPDLAKILGLKELPKGTFESGQMVFDKQRVWSGLLLAAFFNLHSDLYYELFSNYMGKGDKESFAHALAATATPFSTVRHPVGMVGEIRMQCSPSGSCREMFLGNTMTQHSPDGQLLFLHTNLSPKWNLEVPGNFSFYRRRWKVLVPGNVDFIERMGDLENDIYLILVALRCASFLPSYVEIMRSEERMGGGMGLATGLAGFHPFNPGVDFRQAYRWGLSGPYLAFTQVTIPDHLANFLNTVVKRQAGYAFRVTRRLLQPILHREAYFTLW